MPKCDYCGRTSTHLHTGGDARIPGDGINEGACSSCELELATRARAKGNTRSKTAVAKFLADQAAEGSEA